METTTIAPHVIASRLFNTAAGPNWRKLGVRNRHGIAVPLFSLRTGQSGGIGEFLDLIPLIEWCAEVGFSVVQLLPINDTGQDPSPYSAISAFALNPLYLNLNALDSPPDTSSLKPLLELDRVDYNAVRSIKLKLLNDYLSQHAQRIAATDEYQRFVAANPWLLPYALFKVLRAEHERKPWWEWPEELRQGRPDLIESRKEALLPHLVTQFLCDQQLQRVRSYAESLDVAIMGDIPILLSPNSSDVWWHTRYFDRSHQVGSPPDQYSAEGQNWGFPAYQWQLLAQDNYSWWRDRLKLSERHFHVYRLDHVVGFFRLWLIPEGKSGKEGHFIPGQLPQAIAQGRHLLQILLESSSMLPIGEDLGTIPPEVRVVMATLGICGTKVMRWERDWEGDKSFIPVDRYLPESLTCVSTHDSEPLALWWKNQPEESQFYAKQRGWHWDPLITREQQIQILHDSHQSGSLFHINPLQEYLALFPELIASDLQEERVNVPGTCSPKNWTYRFRPSVEQLARHQDLKIFLGELLG